MSANLDYSIRLERLNLKNFRCFGDIEIKLDPRLTVFIAENGGGKTAILDAIADCLKAYLAALGVNAYKANPILKQDVKRGETYANCRLLADISYVKQEEIIDENKKSSILYVSDSDLFSIVISTADDEQKDQTTSIFYKQAQPLKNNMHLDFPALIYYGGSSAAVEYKGKESTALDKINMVYKNALNGSRFQFTTFLNWWKENEYDMLRIKDQTSSRFVTLNDQFTKLKRAIEFILNDDPNAPTYTELSFNEERKIGMYKKTHDGGSHFIELSQFSSGEKALFAFVAELGLRLLHATPLKTTLDADNAYRILGKGIVLIDEIDLHLHPKWQRMVLPKLCEIFPNVQFVVTTHSTEVLKGIHREQLRVIKDGMISSISPYIEGRDANGILQDAFNIYKLFKEDEQKLSELYSLIDKDKDAANRLLAELKEKWGDTDDEIIRAEAYLEIF